MDQSTTSKARPMTSTQGSWFAILAVAIAAFALVTSEFLPVGVLNSVAADLHISVGTAGLIITVPGIMAAIAAPLLPVSVKQLDRRYVLILLTAIMVIANTITAFAENFHVLLLSRLILGISIGIATIVALGMITEGLTASTQTTLSNGTAEITVTVRNARGAPATQA